MSFVNKLSVASNSTGDLDEFIQSNSIEIYDFFISQNNSSIVGYRKEIESYILPKYRIYSQLDFGSSKNQTFLFCLLDVSQRFGLSTEFQQLYNLAKKKGVPLNNRLNATAHFLISINRINDYENRIDEILSDLSVSFLEEEDNEQKTIAALIQFYTEVFNNFGRHNVSGVIEFRNKLLEELKKEEYKFLRTRSVDEVLSYSLDNIEELFQAVQTKLDEILERASQYLAFNVAPQLIETNSHYAQLLADIPSSFREIRNLCVKLYSQVSSDEIFYSLQRGVKVLTESNQLLAYLNSYGKMHYAKMMSAINAIPQDEFQGEIEIYDWGCGQGLASVCLLEHLINQEINNPSKRITLIEPSEIAIKRASLHIRKYTTDSQIITINKDLDSLQNSDFEISRNKIKVHLLSNILDIDLFSLPKFIKLITDNFQGKNIFICASPYVSIYKTERIDGFVNTFRNHRNFQIISELSEIKGEWSRTNWSRVIRVFKYSIENYN